MKNDVEKYIAKRKRTDKAFVNGFEAGYVRMKRSLMPNALTVRALKAAKKGKRGAAG